MDGRHPVILSPMRTAIARRMVHSKTTAPHFYVSAEIEMDEAIEGLERLNGGRAAARRITVTAVLVKALAHTLGDHPAFNAIWEGDTLQAVDAINIGIAVAVPDGLIAPAIIGCDRLDLEKVAESVRDLVDRTATGHLRAAELQDGTFTLSNLGMFEISSFVAIIAPPQVAILATGRTEVRPVVRDGQVVLRRILTATLSADHRALDGASAAAFLISFRGHVAKVATSAVATLAS